jgi:cytochrome c553
MTTRSMGLLFALAATSCNSSSAIAPAPHFGDVMTQVGRRFELLGRAAIANRWDLAAFELGELRETFDDVPRAAIPPDVKADIPQLAKNFVPTIETTLDTALAKRDSAAFATAFATAAGACNGCHHAADRPYIEIPVKPGDSVPRLDPVP